MLNVPDTVKALFKRDGVRKNFRVHFPNGELPDITNENIVQESVNFTESLCSQDVLKFGLTEASVIEFETVGIGNMYGMTIECGIEIDLSSLTAAQLNDIASGTWDGVYTDLASSDIGYAYFRVPYGVFRVESCPRDHQAMAHREVKAYSSNKITMNPFEKDKLLSFYYSNIYKPNLFYLFMSTFYANDKAGVLAEGFTESAVSVSSTGGILDIFFPRTANVNIVDTGGNPKQLTLTTDFKKGYTDTIALGSTVYYLADGLYSLEFVMSPDAVISELATALEQSGTIDLTASGYSSWLELAKAFFADPKMLYPEISNQCFIVNNNQVVAEQLRALSIKNSNEAIYIGGIESTWQYGFNYFRLNYPIKFTVKNGNTTIFAKDIDGDCDTTGGYRFHKYVPTGSVSPITMSFNSTLEQNGTTYNPPIGTAKLYSFSNAYSINDFINGYLELLAKFGRINRTGNVALLQLTDSNPVSVLPVEYSEFWWDEYDVLPIGTINYSFMNSESESGTSDGIASYVFGDGASVYDMTDNVVLNNLTNATTSDVEDLLDVSFIPNLSPIAFTPIEMTMKGLPYMEVGDYLAVTAEDGTIANSFNMKMEINGIQVLTASIESTSGDIIESGESE